MSSSLQESHKAALDFRNELLAQRWPDNVELARLTELQPTSNSDTYADGLRAAGKISSVWITTEGCYRYPDFQFDAWQGSKGRYRSAETASAGR